MIIKRERDPTNSENKFLTKWRLGRICTTGTRHKTLNCFLQYPDIYLAGLGVSKLGNSSVQYELTLFPQKDEGEDVLLNLVNGHGGDDPVVERFGEEGLVSGKYVHVFVDPDTEKSTPIPIAWKEGLKQLST